MKIPQHLLRSLVLGLGAVSITALSGCEPKPEAPTARPPVPAVDSSEPAPPPVSPPVSAPGTCEIVEIAPPAAVDPRPVDPCPPCGRG